MTDFARVASVNDLPAGEMLIVQVDGNDVILIIRQFVKGLMNSI